MRIKIGRTRSGKDIEVPADPREIWVAPKRFTAPERFDAYCVLTYLRAREEKGWRLTADGSLRFEDAIAAAMADVATRTALARARRTRHFATVFDDLRHGRELALPGLRG